jgi:branched-chain amino acid transport system ATP-binding protein
MNLIEIVDGYVGYSKEAVLQAVSLNLNRGEIVTLIGANGAGKSTLLQAISGILPIKSGDLFLEGVSIGHLSPSDRIASGISHVPEGRQIFAGMTVRENLLLGAYTRSDTHYVDQRIRYVNELFPFLADRQSDVAGNLSGGQQQMLAIARGLMPGPRILLLDEPSLGVAPLLIEEIFELIKRLRQEGISILLAEQNARQALAAADRGYVLENGSIVLSGVASELLGSTEVTEKYLGVASNSFSRKNADEEFTSALRRCVW